MKGRGDEAGSLAADQGEGRATPGRLRSSAWWTRCPTASRRCRCPPAAKSDAAQACGRTQPPAPASGMPERRVESGAARQVAAPARDAGRRATVRGRGLDLRDQVRRLPPAGAGRRRRRRLITRNGHDWTAQAAAAAQGAAAELELPDGWYDGEIVVPRRRVACRTSRPCRTPSTAPHRGHRLLRVRRCPSSTATTCAGCRWWSGAAVLQASFEQAARRRLRFSEAFDAPPARPGRRGLQAGPGRRHRQAPRLPTCCAARPTGSSSSAASARSS